MEYKLKPWAHQAKVINKVDIEKRDYFALFHDMGAGKTKSTSEILRVKCYDNQRLLRVLIICPVAVLANWKREILTHTHIEEKEIQIIDGMSAVKPKDRVLKNSSKKRLAEQLNSGKKIFIINTEKVGNASVWGSIIDFNPEFLIIDESHRFKDFLGKRVKALHKFLDTLKPRYRYILTGSPILNSQLDIWAQYYILNPDILGRNFYSFRSEYFYDANSGMPSNVHFPNWKVKDAKYYKSIGQNLTEADTISKLNKIIYAHADRVMKSEVMDLPPITYQTLEVPLTKDQARVYKEMEEEAVAFINENKIDFSKLDSVLNADIEDIDNAMSADTALVRILRLQQVIAGSFITDSGEVTPLNNNRYKVLKDTLSEILSNEENKVILWSVFASTYEPLAAVCEELGVDFTWLTGRQNTIEKQANIDRFNSDPNCRVIIANQGAGGTGVNLTASNYAVYFTRSYKLEHDLQSEARNHRGGQVRNVTRIDLVTPNTIDDGILEALEAKKKLAEDVLEVRKEFTSKDILNLLLKK